LDCSYDLLVLVAGLSTASTLRSRVILGVKFSHQDWTPLHCKSSMNVCAMLLYITHVYNGGITLYAMPACATCTSHVPAHLSGESQITQAYSLADIGTYSCVPLVRILFGWHVYQSLFLLDWREPVSLSTCTEGLLMVHSRLFTLNQGTTRTPNAYAEFQRPTIRLARFYPRLIQTRLMLHVAAASSSKRRTRFRLG
jgi:hypothetical protein